MSFKTNLERQTRTIFGSEWDEREGRVVPRPEDLSIENSAVKISAAVLYADMADSTDLVDRHEHHFAAQMYKAYLHCAASIIKNQRGTITAYDGDRIMAIFLGPTKETDAVRAGMEVHYAVQHIINPLMKQQYPKKKYQLKHVVGIDTSELFATRIGVRNDPDLVWVGRAANYAAKLCSLNEKHSIYITRAVFKAMGDNVKYDGKDRSLMWEKYKWKQRNNMTIYGTCRPWLIS